eukprot:m.611001 g.611001  ORF g.611001 m.611001 type:complete len:718 (+) comp22496_c0_seq1:260-2413(+)
MMKLCACVTMLLLATEFTDRSEAARLLGATHGNFRAVTSRLVELDPLTGDVIQYIGNTGKNINGLAFDRTSSTLYASTVGVTDPGSSEFSLVTIDTHTGQSSHIGNLRVTPSDSSIDERNFTVFMHVVADRNGQLYGWGITADGSYSGLISINKRTGDAIVLSSHAVASIIPPGASLSFNACGSLLFAESRRHASSPQIHIINTTDGTIITSREARGYGHHGKLKPDSYLLYSVAGNGGSSVIDVDYIAAGDYELDEAVGDRRIELISNISRPGLHVLEFIDDTPMQPLSEAHCWDDIAGSLGDIHIFNVSVAGEYTFSTCGSAMQTAIVVMPVATVTDVCGFGVESTDACLHCGPCGSLANQSELTTTLEVGQYSIFIHPTNQPEALPAIYRLSISCPVTTWRSARPDASEYLVDERWAGKPSPLLTRARAKWQTRFYPTVKVFPPPLPYNGLDSACDVIGCPNCVNQLRCQSPTTWGGVECDTTCEVPTCVDKLMDDASNCHRCNVDRTGCVQCRNEHFLLDGVCVAMCPPTTHLGLGNGFYNRRCIEGTCRRGIGNCNECDASSMSCVECRDSAFLYNGQCVPSCPSGTIAIGSGTTGRVCREPSPLCSGSCHECATDGSACVKCGDEQYLHNGACLASCPEGLFEQGQGTFSRVCRGCVVGNAQSCHRCAADGSGCTMCRGGAYLHLRKCVESCPEGFREVGRGSYNNFCAAE